jgi:glucose/arabinose dehydrogenase
MRPAIAPGTGWQNRGMRLRMFLLLLGLPSVLLVGLVLVIRGGHSTVRQGVGGGSSAQPAPGPDAGAARRGVRLVRVGTFDSPVYVTAPPKDRRRLFVVEQTGRIRVLVGGKRRAKPFLDLSRDIVSGGEQGLLSMAFAPDYATSRRFYVYFTDRSGNIRVQQFQRSNTSLDRADSGSRRQVLSVRHPETNHNGGPLQFGPDGYLYIGIGDGGSEGDPQGNGPNVDTLLGKLLRIEPLAGGGYRSPPSNPFAGKGGRAEIYAYGLRNPWRFSFDRKTGDLYIGDVGQNNYEEIDFARRGTGLGRDYGWSCWEGRHRFNTSRKCPNPTPPVIEYSHAGGACSVTGGVVSRNPRVPALRGRYLYGDFCTGAVKSFRIVNGRATGDRRAGFTVPSLSSFGQDAGGRVYAVSLSGPVYRLQAR